MIFKNLSPVRLGVSGRESELIELALSFGFKGLDLDLVDFQQQVQTHGLARARRLLDSARLKLGTFRLPGVWDEDDASFQQVRATWDELLPLAQQLGLSRACTSIAPANDLRPYHENFEFHRRRLSELGEMMASHGIRLGLEFDAAMGARRDRAFQFIHSFDALITLVSMVAAENVGVVVDLWQVRACGAALEDVRKLPPQRIVAVALSDSAADPADAAPDATQRLLPLETGAIDASQALQLLAEHGFEGPVIPAAHPAALQGMSREAIVRAAGERMDRVWKSAGLSPAGRLAAAGR